VVKDSQGKPAAVVITGVTSNEAASTCKTRNGTALPAAVISADGSSVALTPGYKPKSKDGARGRVYK
jgi:hypothetical protein